MSFCSNCPFNGSIKVPYEINSLDYIIVGEAPHTEEVLKRKPFVGKSGQVVLKVLQENKLDRKMFTIANTLCCQLDKKKDDTAKINLGIEHCKNYLIKLLSKAKPKLVISLGDLATKTIAGLQKITENRGRFFKIKMEEGRKSIGRVVETDDYDFLLFVTIHPAYVLRQARGNWLDLPYQERTPVEKVLFDDFKLVSHFIKNWRGL